MHRFLFCVAFILALAGCSEPFVTIPGGELAGVNVEPPAAWLEVPDTIQLETRPGEPYSINIWSVGVGAHLYVATSDGGTSWTEFIDQDARVRVRIEDGVYSLQAALVQGAEERRQVVQAYSDKYDVDPKDGWVADGMIFRLDRR